LVLLRETGSVRRFVDERTGSTDAFGGYGPADLAEIVGQDAPADPPLHTCAAMVPAAPQAEAPLEHANATLDPGPEARRAAEGWPLLPCPALRTALAGFGDGDAPHPG